MHTVPNSHVTCRCESSASLQNWTELPSLITGRADSSPNLSPALRCFYQSSANKSNRLSVSKKIYMKSKLWHTKKLPSVYGIDGSDRMSAKPPSPLFRSGNAGAEKTSVTMDSLYRDVE